MKKFIWITLIYSILISVRAFSANYNWSFNNTEQGDNGRARSVLITGNQKGKKLKNQPEYLNEDGEVVNAEDSETENPQEPISSNLQTIESKSSQNVAQAEPTTVSGPKKWRLALGANSFQKSTLSHFGEYQLAPMVQASFFLIPELGINVFAGSGDRLFAGAELEAIPLDIGFFGKSRFIELGLLMGASTIGSELVNSGTLHAGARINLNLGPRMGIMASSRTNISDRKLFEYAMSDIGLTFRF